jgi:hypothetical protein
MDAELPPGWAKVGPDADGDYYYWNESTNEVCSASITSQISTIDRMNDVVKCCCRVGVPICRLHGHRRHRLRSRRRRRPSLKSLKSRRGRCRQCLRRCETQCIPKYERLFLILLWHFLGYSARVGPIDRCGGDASDSARATGDAVAAAGRRAPRSANGIPAKLGEWQHAKGILRNAGQGSSGECWWLPRTCLPLINPSTPTGDHAGAPPRPRLPV